MVADKIVQSREMFALLFSRGYWMGQWKYIPISLLAVFLVLNGELNFNLAPNVSVKSWNHRQPVARGTMNGSHL